MKNSKIIKKSRLNTWTKERLNKIVRDLEQDVYFYNLPQRSLELCGCYWEKIQMKYRILIF